MTQRLSQLLSVVVLVLALTFATIPDASAMGPALPNRSQSAASGPGESVVLACRASFLVAETDAIEAVAAPHDITTPMLMVEQDSGNILLPAGAEAPMRAAIASEVATTGCVSPA